MMELLRKDFHRNGKITSPQAVCLPTKTRRVKVFVDADNLKRVQLFGFDISYDLGRSWQHWTSGNPPYFRGRFGQHPSVGVRNPELDPFARILPFVVLNGPTRVGLNVEIV